MPLIADAKPFRGKTVLVTGSGQNIGRAIALAFAECGANVVLNGHVNQNAIDAVAVEARALGVGALAVLADVSDPNAVRVMINRSVQEFGRVDIAVSNVALRLHSEFLKISGAEWQRVLDTNLTPSFHIAQAVLPGMRDAGWGRIIHISGIDGFSPLPYRAHNVACKAAVHGLAKAIAPEFGPFGITANTVAPGIIDTVRDWSHYPQFKDGYGSAISSIPVRHIGTVADIANACTYLAMAEFVTGQVIHINGGQALF